jgi:glycerol uptake facilitator-like aquaporin
VTWRRAAADGVGTALLLAAVVGSGIMGEKLAQGNGAIALLANSLATGGALLALILAFGPRSGAHFNPLVSIALALRGDFPKRDVVPYVALQFAGALLGVAAAHLMFDLPLLQYSAKARSSLGLWWSEVAATFGLVLIVLSCDAKRPWVAPLAVAGYITAAYWFTASTSFANPAVTLARGFTDTFAGIALNHVPAFMAAQVLGAGLALLADRSLR